MSPDITPVPEVAEPVTIPIEEETPAAAKLEPGVENEPESVDVEPPIVESVEVDAAPDAKEVDPVVSHGIDSLPTLLFLNIGLLSRLISGRMNPPLRKVCAPYILYRKVLLISRRTCGREGRDRDRIHPRSPIRRTRCGARGVEPRGISR